MLSAQLLFNCFCCFCCVGLTLSVAPIRLLAPQGRLCLYRGSNPQPLLTRFRSTLSLANIACRAHTRSVELSDSCLLFVCHSKVTIQPRDRVCDFSIGLHLHRTFLPATPLRYTTVYTNTSATSPAKQYLCEGAKCYQVSACRSS